MTASAHTLLLVEDDAPQRTTLAGYLRKRGYHVIEAASASEATQRAQEHTCDLLLTDLRLGGPDGVSLLRSLKSSQPELQALVLTAYGTVDDAVRAMRAGAYDFVAKPVDLERLEALIEKALEHVSLDREVRGLRNLAEASGALHDLVGDSPAMQQVKALALKVAPSRAPLLILGESGTGKELLARGVHLASPRRHKPFVAVNCAALPESLVESELFGHEKGSFTGALAVHQGRFELADGGTLFLDEVGDIPLPVQVTLLRVLQSGTFERVGGTSSRTVDVRIVAATHRDLEERLRQGLFREDLYYRLNVVSVRIPPLRERPQDIPLLVDYFLRKHADLTSTMIETVDAATLDTLQRWPFPGNVRQLENWIARAVVLADSAWLGLDDFPAELSSPPPSRDQAPGGADSPENSGLEAQVEALEVRLIREAMAKHAGNKSAAARALQLSERAIRYKIAKYGL
ncbi:MAG: sigma-54 dependent transcriptional regulator [Pseudomonadota bacterium]